MARTVPPQLETDPPVLGEIPSRFFSSAESPARVVLPSLPESHRTIPFSAGASWFRNILAFAGPGYFVAVGYMDPGNWSTDIAGSSKFRDTPFMFIFITQRCAILFSALAART